MCVVLMGAALAQSSSDNSTAPQLPVGQVFKQFEFPAYQDGKLKYTLYATEAKGITLNRAETTDLKIDVYDNGAVTTTITSPKADLLVNEQKMRTKNTVQIERADMSATSQTCDFDVKAKRFVMRTNVKVVLKHFDLSEGSSGSATKTAPDASKDATDVAPTPSPAPLPAPPITPPTPRTNDSLLTSPGSYADTNSAPLPPTNHDTK